MTRVKLKWNIHSTGRQSSAA